MTNESVLSSLDLTDNYIGELNQLKAIQSFKCLTDLSFRKVKDPCKGSNPICDFSNYESCIKMFVVNLAILDGIKIMANESFEAPVTRVDMNPIGKIEMVPAYNEHILIQKDSII